MSRGTDDTVPIWLRPDPGARRPAYTREQIVEAAMKIADEEGFEAVSMRRVAAELGAGTMTLYYYVGNKDELAALMADRIMGELLVPDAELAGDWREGMAQIARRTRALFKRHAWVAEHLDDDQGDGPAGPNALRHVEQSLTVAARTGLPVEDQFDLVAFVDDYVFGYSIRNRENVQLQTKREVVEQKLEGIVAYLEAQLETGEFPHLEAFAGDDPAGAFRRLIEVAADDERFERGLQRVLDGIQLEIERRQAAGSAPVK